MLPGARGEDDAEFQKYLATLQSEKRGKKQQESWIKRLVKRLFGLFRKSKPRHKRVKWCFNCARVHVGSYILQDNDEEALHHWREDRECGYTVVGGEVKAKRIRPIRVKGHHTAGNYDLQTFVLYPKTETAILKITNGHRNYTVKLVKAHTKRSTMFKLKL